MKQFLTTVIFVFAFATLSHTAGAQNMAINTDGSTPDASAMVDIASTTKGFLLPRMTTTQQNAIPSPATGLLIFNTTDNGFKVNTGTPAAPVWTPLLFSGNAITSVNGLTGATQTFTTGTSGSDFGISSSGSAHTFNIPTASATNRGALSAADWSIFNGKQTALGFTPYNATNPSGYISSSSFAGATDATISSPANGQILQYNIVTGKWVNTTPGFLSSYTETDPIVRAINGIVKSNGTTISAAVAGTDYVTPSGNIAGSAGSFTGNLAGEVTGTQSATVVGNAAVIGKVLTGYTSGSGTVAATDNILQAIQKINGNVVLKAPLASPTFTGVPATPTATAGTNTTQIATTAFVTSAVSAGTSTSFSGSLAGEVTGTQSATVVGNGAVIGKVLTGYTSGAGTVAATDNILQAIQKINGNDVLKAPLASPTLTGTPAAPTATAGTNTTQIATTAFVTSAVSGGTSTSFSGSLAGEVSGTQSATVVGNGAVIGKFLTGYTSGAGTVAATDNILQAIQKINGNDVLKAPLASPTLTGVPAAPTATAGTNTTQIATTAFVTSAVSGGTSTSFSGSLAGEVSGTQSATVVGNGAVIGKFLTGYNSGAGTVAATDNILQAIQKINGNDVLKAPLASPTLTGVPAAPTATAGTNTTQIATTAFVTGAVNSSSAAAWALGGNAATAGSNFLGTTNNVSLRMRSNNTERMVIDSIGNVGLGVTDPGARFVLKDSMEIRRIGTVAQLLFTNTAGSGDFRIGGDGNDIFWQGGGGRSLQMGSYWATIIGGDRQLSTLPAFVNGISGTSVIAQSSRDASVPLAVQGNSATQSANLMEWRNSASTVLDFVDKNGNASIGGTALNSTNPEQLLVDAATTTSVNAIVGKGSINNYLQLNIQNGSSGNAASSDVVATANNGSETTNYVDMGINGGGNTSGVMGGANDGYLYTMGNNFLIGTGNASKSLIFMTGGTSQSTNERVRIDGSGNVGIGNTSPNSTLSVTGSQSVSYRSGTGAYTVLNTDYVIINTGGGTPTWTLPVASSYAGRVYRLVNHGTTSVTLSQAVTTASGTTSTTLANTAGSNTLEIISDGSVWRKMD